MIPKPHNPNQYGRRAKLKQNKKARNLKNKMIADEMRENFKQKPQKEVKIMFQKHDLRWIKGKGIFQV